MVKAVKHPLDFGLESTLIQFIDTGQWAQESKHSQRKLSTISWDILLIHVRRLLNTAKKVNNGALRQLQDLMVGFLAVGVMEEEIYYMIEEDFDELDENEKMKSPPRQG